MTFIIFVCSFVFFAHHFLMMYRATTQHNDTQSRVDLSRVTQYDHVNATFNRHGRAIVRVTSRHVI